jgi:hypothetical protein
MYLSEFVKNPAAVQAFERTGKVTSELARQSKMNLDRLFTTMPDKRAVTFRGLSGMNPQALSDMARVGNVVELDASTVTTMNARTALARYAEPGTSALRGEQFAILEYRTSSGMDLRRLNLTGHEDDLILQKGRKFKVVQVQELTHNNLTGKRIVLEEVIPPTKKLIPSEFDSFEAYRFEFKKRTAGLSMGERLNKAKHLDQRVKELQELGTPESKKFASIQKRAARLEKRVADLNAEFDHWYAVHAANPTDEAAQAEITRIMKEANKAHKARKSVDSLTRTEANKLLKSWGTKQRMKVNVGQQVVAENEKVTREAISSIKAKSTNARRWLSGVTSVEDDMTELRYRNWMYENTRAKCMVQSKTVKISEFWGTDVHVHEIGHALEWHKPGGNRAALEFFQHRLKGSTALQRKIQQLQKKFPDARYDADEFAAVDKFEKYFDERMAHYTAKWYGVETDDLLNAIEKTLAGQYSAPPTEIISMGLQALYNDPVGLALKDPEFTKFILGFLDGTLL